VTPVFLTVDTEFAWRHHAAGLGWEEIYARSLEPAGVGIGFQLARLAHHGLNACFFVDPMPALTFGMEPMRRLVGTLLDAGQEVQLHCHPNWAGAEPDARGERFARFELVEYGEAEQADMIAAAAELLMAAGAPAPVAFRAGSFGANDTTLAALARLGFDYDSSHNGAEQPWPSQIALPADHIAPIARGGLIEVPATVIEDRPGRWRTFQVCALSIAEMRAALAHAMAEGHAALTIVSHGFELANRAGTGVNTVHVRRFEALCAMLAAVADQAPTMRFVDRPALRLGQHDRPLGRNALRMWGRRAEQLWSNVVVERAA
jgi:hypothetical protein